MRRAPAIAAAALACHVSMAAAIDIEALWDYADPAASETRFREALATARGGERLELLTQIARTFSLRKRFEEAHRTLDELEPSTDAAGPRVRARYLLERGRTFNSASEKAKARKLFLAAFDVAREAKEDGLAVDAAHMVAIVDAGTASALEWNDRGLDLARKSSDAKARSLLGALLNNKAWDLHAMKRYDEALALFEAARDAWAERGRARQVQVAKWSIARCLRSMGRFEAALEMQSALESELEQARITDRYVFEELAELHAALGRPEVASRYREKARTAP